MRIKKINIFLILFFLCISSLCWAEKNPCCRYTNYYYAESADRVEVSLINSNKREYLVVLKNVTLVTNESCDPNFPNESKRTLTTSYFSNFISNKKGMLGALIFDAKGMKLREHSPVFLISMSHYDRDENSMYYHVMVGDEKNKLQTGIFCNPVLILDISG